MSGCTWLRKNAAKFAVLSAGLYLLPFNGVYAREQQPLPFAGSGASASASAVDDPSSMVVVKEFRFMGSHVIAESELQQQLFPYINRSCNLNTLREAANVVTQLYQQRGLIFAKAYIQPQKIVDGVVVITVVEGRIGKVTIEGNRHYSTNFIHRYLTSGEGPLTIERFERGLLLLNSQFTDLSVTANFVPGQEPGTTDIAVKAVDHFPLQLTLSSNNYGSEYVSRERFGGQIGWSNALISGSQATIGGFVGNKPKNMSIVNGGYVFPLNSVGTMVGVSALHGNSVVGKDFADLGIENKETSGDMYLSHPLRVNRRSTLFGKVGFRAANTKYYYLFDQLSGYDKTRVVYAELQGDMISYGGKSFANLSLSQGLGDMLGGTKTGDILASRQDATNSFTKLNAGVARLQPLSDGFSSLFRLSGQWSPSNLLAGEEWLIGGINSVHGYASGEAAGTEGYTASLSLRSTPLVNKEILQLSLFLDYGYAHKKNALKGSKVNTSLTGVGFGVVSHIADSVVPTDLRFDVGFPLNPTSNALQQNPVFSFDVSVHF